MSRVVVHIERLVLEGFAPDERAAIAAGLQQELGRLLQTPEAARQLAALGHVAALRVAPVRGRAASEAAADASGRPATAGAIGIAAARRIVGGLVR